jgi:hypothetical protein
MNELVSGKYGTLTAAVGRFRRMNEQNKMANVQNPSLPFGFYAIIKKIPEFRT